MSNLASLKEIEDAAVRDIKHRHCRRYQKACQGCPLFVEQESGLDCAAMIVSTALEKEHGDDKD